MKTLIKQPFLNLLIYGSAILDAELSSAYYVSGNSARRAAIGRWTVKHGFRGALPVWFFAELENHFYRLRE